MMIRSIPYFACLLLFSLFLIAVGVKTAEAAAGADAQNDLFTRKVGDMEVTVLVDAVAEADPAVLRHASPVAIGKYAPKGTMNSINAFLIRTPSGLMLADTGLGNRLFAHLEALQVQPEDVRVILLTHMHGDHIGGLLRDGKAAFPNADILAAEPEKAYWADKTDQIKAIAAAYGNRVQTFMPTPLKAETTVADAGIELFPGVRAVAAFGHTPGHTMFLLGSGEDALLLWGDITHFLALQMAYPQITVTYDVDPNAAGAVRQDVLRWVTANKVPVAGMHIGFPGMGGISLTNDPGYTFTPSAQ